MENIIKMLAEHEYYDALVACKKKYVKLNREVRNNYNPILDIERKRVYRIWEFSYKKATDSFKKEWDELQKIDFTKCL